MSKKRRFRLFGSLSIRIMLVAVVAMLMFRYIRPEIAEWAYDTWELQLPSQPTAKEMRPELARLIEDPSLVEDDSMRKWLDKQAEALHNSGSAYFVLDDSGAMLYCSSELSTMDRFALTSNDRFNLKSDGELVGTAYTGLSPIPVKGDRVGFLGRTHFYFQQPRQYDATRYAIDVSDDSEIWLNHLAGASRREEFESHYDRLRWLIDGVVALLTAVVLGLVVSFFLSRRIVRLARETQVHDAGGIPGPFKVGGRDEIGALASSMNDMRERIGELVEGLERRDAARREWVAQVSHDLRTPLTSLGVCLERATESLEHEADSELRDALSLAQHDARRLQALSEDLLDAARLEAGAPLAVEPVLPREVLRDAIKSVHPLADSRGIEVAMSTDGPIEECEADGARLLRACENLLRNAVRHAVGRVEAGVQLIGDSIMFSIQDDGAGFGGGVGPVDVDFVRREGGTKDGASLGLLVVERVAEAHGGEIRLSNPECGGAHASFRIPLQRGTA